MHCPYCDREIDTRKGRCEECGYQDDSMSAHGRSTDMILSFNPLATAENSNRIRVPTWLYLTAIGTLVTISLIVVLYACYRIGVLEL